MLKLVAILSIITIFSLQGCATKYVEKQSEAASQAAWATNLAIEKGRFDLAEFYSGELVKLINPPKERIEIKSIYQREVSK
jgi:hypothetical protein